MERSIDILKNKSDPSVKLGSIVKEKGISIRKISEATGVPYSALQPSFKGNRQLRADEFFAVCAYLDIEPNFFKFEKGA